MIKESLKQTLKDLEPIQVNSYEKKKFIYSLKAGQPIALASVDSFLFFFFSFKWAGFCTFCYGLNNKHHLPNPLTILSFKFVCHILLTIQLIWDKYDGYNWSNHPICWLNSADHHPYGGKPFLDLYDAWCNLTTKGDSQGIPRFFFSCSFHFYSS